jgi:hypothetical protein
LFLSEGKNILIFGFILFFSKEILIIIVTPVYRQDIKTYQDPAGEFLCF